MDWRQIWIDQVLEEVPEGSYRKRLEGELRDHLETQCRALMEAGRTEDGARAEAVRLMGELETLQGEYKAAWRRSLPGRLEALGELVSTWVVGVAVMGGVHLLVNYVLGTMWSMAISLPGNSRNKWVRFIRDTVGNLNNTWLVHWLPLVLALIAGAFYLRRKLQTSRRRVWKISTALSCHWAYITAFNIWWKSIDHHRSFVAEALRYLPYNAWYYALTFSLCILLGVVFGRMPARAGKPAAA